MAQAAPDEQGFFGSHGGSFVAEPLYHAVEQLQQAYDGLRGDRDFWQHLDQTYASFVGRPSPVYHARRLSASYGCRIYLKREDLNHTGSHKINNAIGQVLLAKRLGKTRIIAETGAGQHGVATATACAREGLDCVVYMGAQDIRRQAPNVDRMRLLGATVTAVDSGTCTLKDALNEALRDWVASVANTYYVIGSVAGPHPYPLMVRDFNAVIGREARKQMRELTGAMPAAVVACVGGGSNAIGIFHAFIDDPDVALYGVEAAGRGLDSGAHAAPLAAGAPAGIIHGMRTYVMQDANGQVLGTHSISAGLDYPGVGPEHAWLRDSGRATYVAADDDETLQAFDDCCRLEGIIPALESAHALAYAKRLAPELGEHGAMLVNLSGRGDKDLATVLATRDGPPR